MFKGKADRAERTELMVLITPRLVRALEPDEVPPLPTLPRRFLPAPGVGGVDKGAPGTTDKGKTERQDVNRQTTGLDLVDAPPVKDGGRDKHDAKASGKPGSKN